MTPNGHQSPFDTDDLREALHEDSSQPGFDGEKMLAFSRRARTRRRVGAVALTGTAAVTAVALAFGTGMFNRVTTPDPAGTTALPPSPSQTTSSPSPTATSSRPASSSPASTPASSAPPITTSRPSSSKPSSSSPSTGEKISQLCTDQGTQLTFKNGKNLLTAATPDTRWVVVDERRVIFVYPEGEGEYLTLPQGAIATGAWSDGSNTIIASATANSGDPGATLYLHTAAGGPAKELLTSPNGANVQVRDGFALITLFRPEESSEYRLYDLSTGQYKRLAVGEVGAASLLDGGKALLAMPGPNGMRIVDQDGKLRTGSAGTRQYTPFASNGRVDIYASSAEGRDPVITGPQFDGEVKITGIKGEGDAPTVFGKNFALIDDGPAGYHLIDLRSGARKLLPAPIGSRITTYTLNSQDQLVRHGDNPGHVDLTQVTLNC